MTGVVTSARWMILATKVLNEVFVADEEEEEEGRPIA
jgi:hypothetical protein